MSSMGGTERLGAAERPQRSDALRNRQRLLAAATEVFGERGLEAGVGEIAARAGVGRGTLFRNFPTKADLIAAIVVERMRQAISDGRERLDTGDGAEVAFDFLDDIVHRQQQDRSLFEAVADEFLANPEIRAVHTEFVELVDQLLERGKQAGSIRPEVGAMDVMMLVKGACSAASALDASPELLDRHLSLLRAAISTPGHAVPLRGRTPTLADLEPVLLPVTPSEAPSAAARG
jgi:AcrR family transcriptional regulator